MIRARIYRSSQRTFDCKILATGKMVEASSLGNLLKHGQLVVGDFVEITRDNKGQYVIETLLPRTSEIYRVVVRERKKKVTAANCDLLVIVSSVSQPEFKRGVVDRYLLRMKQWNVEGLLVFNKMDEFNPDSLDLGFEAARLNALGVRSFETSATNAEFTPVLGQGIADLSSTLDGKTALIVGQSGVGKSQLINALTGGKSTLKTNEIARSGKGGHTTSWSEIIDFGRFALIDSPGIRSFAVDDLLPEDLLDLMPDVTSLFPKCKFQNCDHTPDSSTCYFNSLDPDAIETQYLLSRLDSYLKFCEELKVVPHWEKRKG